MAPTKRLSELKTSERAIILRHHSGKAFKKRLQEMGFVEGEEILVVKNAPLRDPVEYRILGYDITLRRKEAEQIEVVPLSPEGCRPASPINGSISSAQAAVAMGVEQVTKEDKRIRVAFVGNPNCGKTSLFNATSGAKEHVGNYGGVTVEAKSATYRQGGYTFDLIDLPGSYSLSSYSPEERFVFEYLVGTESPDVIINVVSASNLERNLYLTTQLMETGLPIVMALNMYDELKESGSELDQERLSQLIGIPIVPTVGKTGEGVEELFEHVIELHEKRSAQRRIIDVRYSQEVEESIAFVYTEISKYQSELTPELRHCRPRLLALKLLEEDSSTQALFQGSGPKGAFLLTRAAYAVREYEKNWERELQEDITAGRYGFVRGALQETYRADYSKLQECNRKIDHILTHKVWGFPIFILLMYLMFQLTFSLGAYPMTWIEDGISWLGAQIGTFMPEGPLKDLLIDGIIGGVGGVLVFLPNIVILYLCIALMEDTGYLARAAFIMDRLMHGMGLHGKSFIPMLMGFGCNIPAILSTRTIENRTNRIITMLVIPFMSCSARLPVYLLLAGTFFPQHAGLVLFGLYTLGIIIAVLSALIFKRSFFKGEDTPFVMELPPYRTPTLVSVLLYMWQRAKQYLMKMGGIILVASIAIWVLNYFPRMAEDPTLTETEQRMAQQEYSYIGRIGKAIQPAFEPLGYDWKMSVALLTGASAKEIVVSTMGVLYTGDSEDETALPPKLQAATHPDGRPVYTPAVTLSFLVFVLVYFPCIATIAAIAREASWKWAAFSVVYTTALAWVLGYLITNLVPLLL